ncbi:Mariner Mos1 transposase [Eumeta japonica]|uniref:Mariner Mos1 transposase n=1 Tax=Eumeta variegata TaxID=151549 RepID=A0A4C1WNY0_EUMVA|nr:Mariner Mos1 transposase [Eumeta japonica]
MPHNLTESQKFRRTHWCREEMQRCEVCAHSLSGLKWCAGASTSGAYRLLVEAYNKAALSKRTCREWFQKFENGDFDVEHKARSGRPKIYEDAELEELLEEHSSQAQKELALTLEVTQQAVLHRLESLGMIHEQEQRFTSYEDTENWVDLWIASKDKEFFRLGSRTLPERWKKVVASDGLVVASCENGSLLQHKNFVYICSMSPKQDATRHRATGGAEINDLDSVTKTASVREVGVDGREIADGHLETHKNSIKEYRDIHYEIRKRKHTCKALSVTCSRVRRREATVLYSSGVHVRGVNAVDLRTEFDTR